MSRSLALLASLAVACASSSSTTPARLQVSVAPDAVTLQPQGTGTLSIALVRTGYTSPVTITVAGLDAAGVTADPLIIAANASSGMLTLRASAAASAGVMAGTIQANGADANAAISVTVQQRAGFSLAIAPGEVELAPGGSSTVAVTVGRDGSFAGAVNVVLAALPTGVSADPLTIPAGEASGTLTLHAADDSPATASARLIANGTSGSLSATAELALTVLPASGEPLQLVVTPSTLRLARGASARFQVDVVSRNYNKLVSIPAIDLRAAGIDTGGTSIQPGARSGFMEVFAGANAPLGTTSSVVIANNGEATAAVTVTVVEAGPLRMEIFQPALTIAPGGTAFTAVEVDRVNGLSGAIAVAVSGLPTGVSADPLTIAAEDNIGSIVLHGDGSGAGAAAVPIQITATLGDASTSGAATLTIEALSVAVSSPGLNIGLGQTGGVAVHTAGLTSIAGPRAITVEGLPRGVSVGDLRIAEGDESGALTLAVANNAQVGLAHVVVTATAGAALAHAQLALNVERNEVRVALDRASLAVAAGASARATVEIERTGLFRTLALPVSVSGLPRGVTADPLLVDIRSTRGLLTLRASSDAAPGGPVRVSVDAGSVGTPDCTFDCTVLASAPLDLSTVAPFEVALATPSPSVQLGATVRMGVRLTRNAGFAGVVRVEAANAPAGIDSSIVLVGSEQIEGQLLIIAAASAQPGDVVLTITSRAAGANPFQVVQPLPLHVFARTAASPAITTFAAESEGVFVGERARLTAVFDADSGAIDGIGPVQSGVPLETAALGVDSTFILRVRRGDEQVEAIARVFVTYRDRFRAAAPAAVGRSTHLAAPLPDGSALIMGGFSSESPNVPDSDTTSRFNPAAESMAAGPDLPLTVNAPNTTVAPLASGQLLLVGAGINSFGFFSSRTTVLFDPTTQTFTQAGDAEEGPNFLPTITPLLDGTALMAGGARGLQPFASAERFDPGNNSWLPAGSMSVARLAHSATRLHDGRVLIAGGLACCVRTQDTISQFFADTAEIYDPETDSFTATGSMATARALHTATLLDDGRVLIAGGLGSDPEAPANTEIYDPATGLFSPAGDLHVARANAAATALTDGRVLLTGGVAPDGNFSVGIQVTELFVPGLGWVLGPPLQPSWTDSTTTLLGNGKVLIFGGQTTSGAPQSRVLLYE